jgi:general secretion pathway protein G
MNLANSILRLSRRSGHPCGQCSGRRSSQKAGRGFTMLELMVVIAVILVLVAMAAGSYQRSLVRSREAVLKQDLATMRNAIQQYTLDKEMGPSSLDDLVSAGYLREVPTDPITRERIWHTNFEDVLLSPDQSTTGVTDVHSTSDTISPFESTPYNSW